MLKLNRTITRAQLDQTVIRLTVRDSRGAALLIVAVTHNKNIKTVTPNTLRPGTSVGDGIPKVTAELLFVVLGSIG